jgi:hypothetical protein
VSLSYALSQVPVLATLIRNGDWSLNGGLVWITTYMVVGLVLMVVALSIDPTRKPSKRIRTLPPVRN